MNFYLWIGVLVSFLSSASLFYIHTLQNKIEEKTESIIHLESIVSSKSGELYACIGEVNQKNIMILDMSKKVKEYQDREAKAKKKIDNLIQSNKKEIERITQAPIENTCEQSFQFLKNPQQQNNK